MALTLKLIQMAGLTDSRGPLGPIALVLGPLLGVVFFSYACTPATQGTGKGTGKETEGCYGGAFCDPELQCVYGFCVADDETEGSESEDEVGESTSESTTTGDPSEESTSEESTSEESTSEESTSEESTTTESTSEESTSEELTSEESTTTGEPFNCGWDPAEDWYDCGFQGEDPQGQNPIECPAGLVPGAPCNGMIDAIGCCDMSGDLWFCNQQGKLGYEPC